MQPQLPDGQPATFRTSVHGTIFGDRTERMETLKEGDPLVWVHLDSGDPVGHLPPEICSWLAVWLLRRGKATATAVSIHGPEVPSWKRLIVEVHCHEDGASATDGTSTADGE
ncbi:MAG TPA: hypothetical protein VK358_14425 [Longimicrobium sp.]|nr:hypothetical protein [Longimicrobium sp.]